MRIFFYLVSCFFFVVVDSTRIIPIRVRNFWSDKPKKKTLPTMKYVGYLDSLQKNRLLLVFFVRSQFETLLDCEHWSYAFSFALLQATQSADICDAFEYNIYWIITFFVGKRNEEINRANWTKPFKISNYRCLAGNEIFFNESLTNKQNETTVNLQFTMHNSIVN